MNTPTDAKKEAEIARPDEAVDVGALRVGMRLTMSLYDQDGILLLSAGTTITPQFLSLLHARDIQWLNVHPNQSESSARLMENLDEEIEAAAKVDLELSPLGASERPRLQLQKFREEITRGLGLHEQAATAMVDTCGKLMKGDLVNADALAGNVKMFADMVALDLDLLPTIMSLRTTPDEYIFDHSANVAGLSITMATQLGMSRSRIMELGLGTLLQDVGMLQVAEEIRLAPRPLNRVEILEVRQHPRYSLDYLQRVASLPEAARFIGYQAHERLDRSGYPKGRSSLLIHPYAKLASVADAYSAMTSPRPHRAPICPHDAVKEILLDCNKGKFDSVYVRALLDCISLFPVGSNVRLDDGKTAKVIRATPGEHTRPVIQMFDDDGEATDVVIDLSKKSRMLIVEAI